MGWISPTGHIDPHFGWGQYEGHPEDVYDDNLDSRCDCTQMDEPLILTHDAIDCDKIRFKAGYDGSDVLKTEVYYNNGWHEVFNGHPTDEEGNPVWREVSLGGSYSLTQVRFTFSYIAQEQSYLYEVDFGQTSGCVRALIDGSLAKMCLTGKGLVNVSG